jgi:hypothetical protein
LGSGTAWKKTTGADLIWVFDRGAHVFGTEFDSEVGDEFSSRQ